MDTTPNAAWIESHTDYLRRVARALLRSSDQAEDAVQETCLKATQAGPVAEGSRRAWLGSVLRNVVRQDWRTAARRSRREQRAMRRQAAPSAANEVARLEQVERLLVALRALTVEKRHVLEMRYFEGLPPRRIAERLEVPVDTVKTRLRRGLAELRTRLGADEGRDWRQRLALALGLPLGLPWRAVALPVACGLALVVCATLWSGVLSPPAGPATRSTSTSLAGEAATALEAALAARQPVLHGQVAASAPDAVGPPAADAAPPSTTLALEVTLMDAAGRALPPPTGELMALVQGERGSDYARLTVVAGRCALELPEGMRPEFLALACDAGAACVLDPTGATSWHAGESHVVPCQLVPPTRLRVVDAVTLQDLTEVVIVRARGAEESSGTCRPPGGAAGCRAVSSPTYLAADMDSILDRGALWRVWAPGYAWQCLSLRAGADVEQVVHMRPGGRLRLHLHGPRLPVPAQLVVLHDEPGKGSHTTSLDVRGPATHDIEGVPTGPCRIRVVLGDRWNGGRTLGEAPTEIRQGDRSDVTLSFSGATRPPAVPLAGTMHLPEGWSRDRLTVAFQLEGPALRGQRTTLHLLRLGKGLDPVEGAPEAYAFDLGNVQAGTYLVLLKRIGFRTRIETGPSGTHALRVEVPPPVDVTVRVRGDTGGRLPFLAKLCWRVPLRDHESFLMYERATRESPGEPFRFLAPRGRLHVTGQQGEFAGGVQDAFVDELHAELVLDVKPTALIELRVLDGDRSIPWDQDWSLQVTPLEPGARLLSRSTELEAIGIVVSGPGAYELQIGPIEGFEPVRSLEVTVGRDLHAEVTVPLVRRP